MIYKRLTLVMVLCLMIVGVQAQTATPRIAVMATTSIIADVARNIGGDLIDVQTLIPVGNDVHSYSPKPQDVAKIVDADIVLMNGFNLEESLLEIIEENSEPLDLSIDVQTVFSSGVLAELGECETEEHDDEAEDEHDHGPCDPHVWMNPANVMIWAETMADAFAAFDPEHADEYEANAAAYSEQLMLLDEMIRIDVESIPSANRVLVANHGFLQHYAIAYELEFVGAIIPGVSTLAETDPKSLINLIEIIEDRGVLAIFAEVSVNSDMADVVAAEVGHDVLVVSLFTGTLSDENGPASTYLDYMLYNTSLIVEALGGEIIAE